MSELAVDGFTLSVGEDGGVVLRNWFTTQRISAEDAVKIRDWLNLNFPTGDK